jgi:serine/threonine protein kinase
MPLVRSSSIAPAWPVSETVAEAVQFRCIPLAEVSLSKQRDESWPSVADAQCATWRDVPVTLAPLPSLKADEIQHRLLVLSTLRHPNVVEFLGTVCERSLPCGVLFEPLPYNLEALFEGDSNQQLTKSEVLDVAADVAKGLAYLHSESVVFRSLSSTSVQHDGKNAKLAYTADIVKFNISGSSNAKQALAADALPYSAPETVAGRFSSKSDVYSFGVLLAQLVSYCTYTQCELALREYANAVYHRFAICTDHWGAAISRKA